MSLNYEKTQMSPTNSLTNVQLEATRKMVDLQLKDIFPIVNLNYILSQKEKLNFSSFFLKMMNNSR